MFTYTLPITWQTNQIRHQPNWWKHPDKKKKEKKKYIYIYIYIYIYVYIWKNQIIYSSYYVDTPMTSTEQLWDKVKEEARSEKQNVK